MGIKFRAMWPPLVLVGAAAAIFFLNLGAPSLWDIDEPRNAQCAREMFEAGDWVVPTFNGELRDHKPVLLYWFIISAYKLFGVTEFAARFWSAALSIGAVLMTYQVGRKLFDARTAFWSGLILATSLNFIVVARAATPDAVYIFFTTAAFAIFATGAIGARQTGAELPTATIPSRRRLVWVYAAIGMAVLTKGPVGVVLNVAVLGLWALLGQQLRAEDAAISQLSGRWARFKAIFAWRRLLSAARALRPWTAMAVVALVALPWYAAVSIRTGGAFLSEFLLHHNLERFVSPMENHEGPFFYYAIAICLGFFPWSLLLVGSVKQLIRRVRPDGAWDQAWLFICCWIGVYVVFFTFSTTKLPHYILPIYPALALVSGAFVSELLKKNAVLPAYSLRFAGIGLINSGLILVIALLITAKILLPGESLIAVGGLAPIAGGGVCLWLLKRGMTRTTVGVFAATAAVFALVMFGFVIVRVDRHQTSAELAETIRTSSDEPVEIAAYMYFRPSWVFYSGQTIGSLQKAKDVEAFLEDAKNPYVITNEEGLAKLQVKNRIPPGVVRVAELPKFLRKGNVVVLARESAQQRLSDLSRIRR